MMRISSSIALVAFILTAVPTAAQNYQLVSTGQCSDTPGCSPITTADECLTASQALNQRATRVRGSLDNTSHPPYCYQWSSLSLFFNGNADSTANCSDFFSINCLCSCQTGATAAPTSGKLCGAVTICDDCDCCSSSGLTAQYCDSGYKCNDDNTGCVKPRAWWIWLIIAGVSVAVIASIVGCVCCCCCGSRPPTQVQPVQGVIVMEPVQSAETVQPAK